MRQENTHASHRIRSRKVSEQKRERERERDYVNTKKEKERKRDIVVSGLKINETKKKKK